MVTLSAFVLGGCAGGQVVEPFNPKDVNPEPYTPDPVWNEKSDLTLTSIQTLKMQSGQTVAPSGKASGSGTAGTGLTPGGATPTPIPGPGPSPAPTPGERIPSTLDPINGSVYDRIEGGVIPYALVQLFDKRGEVIDTILTNASGMYSFTGLAEGSSYKVAASANGYSTIPLSEFSFIYPLMTNPVNLYLAYASPYQELTAGKADFNLVGTIGGYSSLGYTATDAAHPEWEFYLYKNYDNTPAGPYNFYGDVMPTDFFSAATQKTYHALLYDYKGLTQEVATGLVADSRGWAEYTFTLPDPRTNKYSFDGLWLYLPESYTPSAGVWNAGGYGSVYYYNWAVGNYWQSIGSTSATSFVMPPFWAVKPTTDAIGAAGQVNLMVFSDQDTADPGTRFPYVLTKVKLSYDYHRDTGSTATIPTIRAINKDGAYLYIQVPENCYMTLHDASHNEVTISSSHIPFSFDHDLPVSADEINEIHYTGATGPHHFHLIDQAGNANEVPWTL